ncbi:MAG: ABC transporter ATP-binding protein [Pseudomonadota bacterium]
MPQDNLLEFRNLKIGVRQTGRTETVTLVRGVSATLEKGKVLGLIGESGAGKSTIGLSALGYGRGEVEITGGEVILNGHNILAGGKRALNKLRGRTVCYVAQSAAAGFNPSQRLIDQTIEATLEHGLMSRKDAVARARALYADLSLPEPDTIGERYPHQVSGGQLQRVMTAMALCPGPDLVVFDEPTTALDVTTQLDVLAAMKHAIREAGVAAIYITHDLAVVAQMADDIMVLKDGITVEYGPTRQIIEVPNEDYTKALLSVRSVKHEEQMPKDYPILDVRGVTAAYGRGLKVLDDVSMGVARGQTLAVVGESGSGKSTLARAITGLLPPMSGDVSFEGRALSPDLARRSKEDRRRIQMIYQMAETAMNPRQSVATIIGRPLQFYHGLSGKALIEGVQDLLHKIALPPDFASRTPGELSGGQRQRICIARALAADPDVMICDEVTSALDPLVADGILRLLLDIQAREDLAMIFITHDLATVESIADSVAVMHRGRVLRYGPKSQAIRPPFDPYTEKLIASVPQMDLGWLDSVIGAHTAGGDQG